MKRLALISLALAVGACAPMRKMAPFHDSLSADEHFQLASSYEAGGDLGAAEREYRAAAKGDRKNMSAFIGLGNTAFALGHQKEAELAFLRAHRLEPDNAAASNNLAMLYTSQGRKLNVAERLAVSAARDPRLRPYALDTLATIYLKQGKTDAARAALDEARKLAPADDPNFLPGLEKTARQFDSKV